MSTSPESAADVAAGLRGAGYLPGESTALVSFCAPRLGFRRNPRGIDLMFRHGHALVVLRWARARRMFDTITKGP
jgi:hypothetical protein